jgi:hypothetical protein
MARWLWAVILAAGLMWPQVGRAQQTGPIRLETKWLRIEVDPGTGAVIGLAADPAGRSDFAHPVIAAGGAAAERFGISPVLRGPEGQTIAARPGDGFGIAAAGELGAAITGLRIGDGLSGRLELALSPDAAAFTMRAILRADVETTCQWAGLLVALDPTLSPGSVYFAGRQGLTSISSGHITAPGASTSGAVCKSGIERTFVITCRPPAGAEVEVAQGRAALGLSPHIGSQSLTLRPGDVVTVEATLTFGLPRIPALKPVTAKFEPLAQDFILWASHIATTRPFGGADGNPRWMQETAGVIDPGLSAEIQQAYRRCWLRDVAHGWKSASLVAGPELLAMMRDEILGFSEKLNEAGQPPTHIGADGSAQYGNLDSAGLLIGMIYDYVSRTGDTAFVRAVLPQAERMGGAIISLIGKRDLPVIGEGGDTYPDLGFIKGEQTYLTAVCCDGLRKLARLHEILGETEAAGKWHMAANRVGFAANRAVDKGGLWDADHGVYIGWRMPDGSIYRNEESFANLWAIYSGVCDAGDRIRAIFARLNANWQRYYLDGLCPTAHSIEPYPNGLNQWVPWAGGWDVYLRAKFGEPKAAEVWRLFRADYERTDFPYREASGYQQKEANIGNRARVWDSWGLLQAIYAGHYGIEMTPGHLRVLPRPLEPITDDGVAGLAWRDASYDIALRGHGLNLASIKVDGQDWASCVLPGGAGKHEVTITASSGARKAFVIDAAPMVQVLAAEHRAKGVAIAGSVPSAGRYWYVIQWPDAWGRMAPETMTGAESPQVARLSGDRAAIILSVLRAGKFGVSLSASGAGAAK